MSKDPFVLLWNKSQLLVLTFSGQEKWPSSIQMVGDPQKTRNLESIPLASPW